MISDWQFRKPTTRRHLAIAGGVVAVSSTMARIIARDANGAIGVPVEWRKAVTMPTLESSIVAMDMREFKTFRELIHRKTGIWLRDGKQAMLAGRLSKRLRHHGMNDFATYAAYVETVQDGGKELAEIINCVTTNKTSFFREKHHFDFLAQKLVPDLIAGAALGRAQEHSHMECCVLHR